MTENRAPCCDNCGAKLLFYGRRTKRENGERVVEYRYYCPECRRIIKTRERG